MKAKNNRTIDSAFKRFASDKDEIIKSAMYGILEDAVQVALSLHEDDGEHEQHLVIGDTYGWLLMHNGHIEEAVVVSTPNNEGDTLEQLREEAAFITERGWVGIVMAGMRAGITYFSMRFENKVLNRTIKITKDNFFEYFKKI